MNDEIQKRCNHCKNLKDLSCFGKSKFTKDRLHGKCKKCCSEIRRKQALILKEKGGYLPDPNLKIKKCYKCKLYKDVSNFYKATGKKDGYQAQCTKCYKIRPYRQAYGPIQQNKRYLKELGISIDEIKVMIEAQNFKCKICPKTIELKYKHFAVDHAHVEDFESMSPAEKRIHIRGILCTKCNFALGLVDDNCTILESAIQYLKDYQNNLNLLNT